MAQTSEALIELTDIPQCDTGSPQATVLASEQSLLVVYVVQHVNEHSSGNAPHDFGAETDGEFVAVVSFELSTVHTFGLPNDETIHGHSLHAKGLKAYGAYEVFNSRWIQQLEQVNSVHPRHDRQGFLAGKRHFILSFHDSTFECVALGYTIEVLRSSVREVLAARLV
jgi:hypothetical protein